ncbi:MAG: tRNA (N(6)-L-threonylcarbamoyladenosine(37)-C(2))-methylthiotransferase MtaB [Treponema sp.]|nr:tRNA (N(6)-L-threonylcarbamoyladenosine(37)-C(2))-methylthiotransferase MtaB [Treponema sp.]
MSVTYPLTVCFETLGCRLNQDETEGAAQSFRTNGFTCRMGSISASDACDDSVFLCILNTCTVTGKAEQKARRIIRLMLKNFPKATVLVTGCYAELDGDEITAICPERIVIVKGTQKYLLSQLASSLRMLCSQGNAFPSFSDIQNLITVQTQRKLILNPKTTVSDTAFSAFTLYTANFQKHSRASLKIQDGCNCACSFCRIHFARGKSVSLSASEVVSRVKNLEQNGMNEVVLTGVNLSQYASQESDGTVRDLAGLLELILKETSHIRIRLSSLYPQSVTERLCAVLADSRIQSFFHLSIQSGSERILKLMKRPHSVSQVEEAITLLRSVKKAPFISCDLIAGFPTETDEDFSQTVELCKRSGFAWIHAFPFSPRPGTDAVHLKPCVPERIKGERVALLTQLAVDGKLSYIERWKDKPLFAIVEHERGLTRAVTENFLHVQCEKKLDIASGSAVTVRILQADKQAIVSGSEVDCLGSVIDVQ